MTGQKKDIFAELKQRWEQLREMEDHNERGRQFDFWLRDLFQASGLKAEGPFTRPNVKAQIDGLIYCDGIGYFLIEAKWQEKRIGKNPVTIFMDNIHRSTKGTYGLLISTSGFSRNAIEWLKGKSVELFLIDNSHLEAILDQKINGKDWLKTFHTIATRKSTPYIPFDEIQNEIRVNVPVEESIRLNLKEMARHYREKFRQELETRKYRDWYRYRDSLIPFSLEIVKPDETLLGLERVGDMADIEEAFQQQPHWIILGEAGIGKSTLLENFLIEPRDTWPVLLNTTNNSKDPVKGIQKALMAAHLSLSEEEIKTGLKLRAFSILIDGLEERDEAQKKQIIELCDAVDLTDIHVLVAVRETVFLNLKGSMGFPGHYGMLRLRPITSARIRPYLDSRLGQEKGQQACKAIADKKISDVFRTPLSLDIWLKYASTRDFHVPDSKIEILEHFFNSFFDEWEIPKVPGHHPAFLKERLLIRLAQFMFAEGKYMIQRGNFERFFYRAWNELLKDSPEFTHFEPPLEVMIHHGLITPKGQYMGFSLPLYRDYFLIRGMKEAVFGSHEKGQLAEICVELNFISKARGLYWEAAFEPGADIPTKIAAALFFKKQEELDKAAKIMQTALPSSNPKLYQIYALILKGLGRFKEAEAMFKKGIEADDKHAPSYQALALMLKEMGRVEEAGKLMSQSVKTKPDVRTKISFLNILFYCLNRIDEAEPLANQLLQNEKIRGKNRTHLNLTLRLIQWRRDYQKGKPEAIENRKNLYQFSKESGYHNNYDAAEIALKELYDQQPPDFSTCQRLGRLLIRKGNNEGTRFLEEAMELNPEPDLDSLNKIIYSAIAAGHYDWAQTQLDSFLQKEPVNSELLRLQAILRAKKGQYEDAQKIFSSAYNLAAAPGIQATVLREQARILLDRDNPGDRRQAEILLEKALVLKPGSMGTFKMKQELYSRMNRLPEKKNFYQLIRERLEPGDIIDVKLYRVDENREVQCYYYGVPCNLTWHGIAKKYKKGSTIRATFCRLNEKRELNLEWSETSLKK